MRTRLISSGCCTGITGATGPKGATGASAPTGEVC